MNDSRLPDAYDDLMAFLYEAMDDTLHSIADAMEIAKNKTHELNRYTQEEINAIADYLMRDLDQVAQNPSLIDENNRLSEWLKFDIALVENFAIDSFMSIADKTRLQLKALELDARQYHPYASGEVASPGTFECKHCHKQLAFKSTSLLPKCPNCGESHFTRC
jgi:Zinc-ribbon containing domain